MKVIFSHPTGNSNVRAAVNGLAEANLLADFYTTIASFPGSILDRLGAIPTFSEIKRRGFDARLQPFTKTRPFREVGRLVSEKAGFSTLIKHETGFFCIDSVYKSLDKDVASTLKQKAKQGVGCVYAYEDEAEFSFIEAKRYGVQCLYDLPTGYWRAKQLFENERIKRPEWASTIIGFRDSEEKLLRKDKELSLADRIFVASKFTASTLQEFPGNLAPIEIIPYGFPLVNTERVYTTNFGGRKVKVLFVGKLSQQKGIANLFEAVKTLGNFIELTVVGRKVSESCTPLNKALAGHRWIPTLPHHQILQIMRENDLLVFPSLFDGFGLVITEGMSQGTPVIATNRTAGPDLIEDSRNGWIVEAGSTEELKAAIEGILSKPQTIAKVGREAMETARKRPWEVYGRELAEVIISHLS